MIRLFTGQVGFYIGYVLQRFVKLGQYGVCVCEQTRAELVFDLVNVRKLNENTGS